MEGGSKRATCGSAPEVVAAWAKDAPVGFQRIRLEFVLDTDASAEQLASLRRLTERYCVVYQTLRQPALIEVSLNGQLAN
jgi:uncharacterized OsmC-like protein